MPELLHVYNNDNVLIRLSVLETNMSNAQSTLDNIEGEAREHRRNHTAQTQEINTKMESLRKELKDDLSTVKNELKKAINEEIKLIDAQFFLQNKTLEKIENKLDGLDKWRWIVVGFATAIGFVIAEFTKFYKLFN
jgi:C-terminal processing protease CtpA/Prc